MSGQTKVFGIPLTPEFIFKLLVLVFAAGGAYSKLEGMEERVRNQIMSQFEVVRVRLDAVSERMTRVENTLDRGEK